MRKLKINPLGVYLEGELINVLLIAVSPDDEAEVVARIKRRILIHRKRQMMVDDACSMQVNLESIRQERKAVGLDAYERDGCVEIVPTLPLFVSLLGEMQLAAIFRTHSYGIGENICTVNGLKAVHCIQGAAVVPDAIELRGTFRVLQQWNSGEFIALNQVEIENGRPQAATPPPMPLFSICRVQISGLVRTLNAAAGYLPLLHVIEHRLQSALGVCDETIRHPKALLLASSDWSDFTLLVSSNAFGEVRLCVDAIAGITVADVFDAWEDLIEQAHGDMIEVYRIQQSALVSRYKELAKCANIGGEIEFDPARHFAANHIFTQANTIPGVIWPFAEAAKSTSFTGVGWGISGEIDGELIVSTKLGHEKDLSRCVLDFAEKEKLSCEQIAFRMERTVFGYYDFQIPLSELLPLEPTGSGGMVNIGGGVQTLEVLLKYYRLMDTMSRGTYVPEGGVASAQRGTPLRAATLVLRTTAQERNVLPLRRDKRIPYPFSTRDYLESLVRRGFGRGAVSKNDSEKEQHARYDALMAVKKLRTSRHLRDKYLSVAHHFQEQLMDPCDSTIALELVDAYLAWHMAVQMAPLCGNVIAREAEDVLRAFTEPFSAALNRNSSSGARRSNHIDSVGERWGRTTLAVNAWSGLAEGVMALLGPVYFSGGILRVDQRPSAETLTITVPSRAKLGFDCTYAVFNVNPNQASHPMHIGIILHEFLHPVSTSNAFLGALAATGSAGGIVSSVLSGRGSNTVDPYFDRCLLNELVVGFLFARLVCFNGAHAGNSIGGLYSKIILLLLAVDKKGTDNDVVQNMVFLAENALQCFLVEMALSASECGELSKFSLTILTEQLEVWWRENWPLLLVKEAHGTEVFLEQMKGLLKDFAEVKSGVSILQCLKAVAFATDNYFGVGGEEYDDLERSRELRREFWRTLREEGDGRCAEAVELMRSGLKGEEPCYRPVHFVFCAEAQGDKVRLSLRESRLESLLANVVLIRAFYIVLLEDLIFSVDPGEGCMHLCRSEVEDDIDFRPSAGRRVLIDRANGALFTVGSASSRQYMSLRHAMALSMWQTAEVRKLSEVLKLEELLRKFEDEELLLFVPDGRDAVDAMRSMMAGGC
ncbi:MAG: hypothetical protein HYV27_08310 [Candidatus Hydrogenedentes bacterium]|nr:hypothetical protein [Candidatus Hydrogenedentota bacterium]